MNWILKPALLLTAVCPWENYLPLSLRVSISRLKAIRRHYQGSLGALKFCDLKEKIHIIAMFNGIYDNWKIIAAPNFY